MEWFKIILEFVAEISWPLTVFGVVFMVLYAFRENWIGTFKIWNKTGGLMIKEAKNELVNKARDIIASDKSVDQKAEQIGNEFLEVISNFDPIESGENANGKYWWHQNGIISVKVTIPPGKIKGQTHLVFPASFGSDNIVVSFSGQSKPKIVSLSATMIVLELETENSDDIVMNAIGFHAT